MVGAQPESVRLGHSGIPQRRGMGRFPFDDRLDGVAMFIQSPVH